MITISSEQAMVYTEGGYQPLMKKILMSTATTQRRLRPRYIEKYGAKPRLSTPPPH